MTVVGCPRARLGGGVGHCAAEPDVPSHPGWQRRDLANIIVAHTTGTGTSRRSGAPRSATTALGDGVGCGTHRTLWGLCGACARRCVGGIGGAARLVRVGVGWCWWAGWAVCDGV